MLRDVPVLKASGDKVKVEVSYQRPNGRVSRKDVSAADVARSLLTGHFAPQGDAAAGGAATIDHGVAVAAEPAVPADTPVAGRLSDTFGLSSSSVVLPGSGRQAGKKPPSAPINAAKANPQKMALGPMRNLKVVSLKVVKLPIAATGLKFMRMWCSLT